jgi:hypothetical protein
LGGEIEGPSLADFCTDYVAELVLEIAQAAMIAKVRYGP